MLTKLRANFADAWAEEVRQKKDFWLNGGWKRWLKAAWKKADSEPPYWHRGMEREYRYSERVEVVGATHDIVGLILLCLFAAIFILLPMAYINTILFTYPGGFVRLIAEFLAQVCGATGDCEFGQLMAGFTFAVQFLSLSFCLIVMAIHPTGKPVEETVDVVEDDVSEHEQLDDRIIALREELMGAGILTKPPEEMPEED